MATRILKPFRFFVLLFDNNKFEYVLITEEFFVGLDLAKIKVLYSFSFSETDVPVIMDHNYNFYYYHFGNERWYKNCSEEQLKALFPYLVPLSERSLDISSNVGAAICSTNNE